MKTKRCGYCGTPIDNECNPLSVDKCNELTEKQLEEAELDHGNCCAYDQQQEDNYITVTKDMASDAGEPSLEGMQWKW
jgi:hypothetical protein|tara:strand:+ start:1488 stop:1721 length:234 start_codon:yes stop_codon:yes gene_type:complete